MRFPGPLGSVGREAPDWPPYNPLRDLSDEVAAQLPDNDGLADLEFPAREPRRARDSLGPKTAAAAEYYLGHSMRGFRDDCSGLVCAALARAGLDTQGTVHTFYERARDAGALHHHKRPRIGDLIFWDNTYDANHNGRWDDKRTHIGVVIGVDPNGTIQFAHGGTGKGRVQGAMNLDQPEVWRDANGKLLNSAMRRKRASDPRAARYLAGELFVAFATVSTRDRLIWQGVQ